MVNTTTLGRVFLGDGAEGRGPEHGVRWRGERALGLSVEEERADVAGDGAGSLKGGLENGAGLWTGRTRKANSRTVVDDVKEGVNEERVWVIVKEERLSRRGERRKYIRQRGY